MAEPSEAARRELIYVSERIKAIKIEKDAMIEERDTLRAKDSDEDAERRRRIYVTDRIEHLDAERDAALERRAALMDQLS
ncbi:MAG: hypothetical protein AAFQ51_00160 [Pseudomonadota bacterium]